MRLRKSSGKVLDLSMEEGSGTTAYDSSRYGNDGAVNGGVEWVEHGMRFDGSTGYLNCGNDASLNITDAITIEAWVNATSKTGWRRIISKENNNDGYAFLFDGSADEKLYFSIYNGGVGYRGVGNVAFPTNEWVSIVGTYDRTKVKLYIDGILQTSQAAYTGDIAVSGTDLRIGSYSAAVSCFDGIISDAHIYNRALTPLEIKHDYDATKYKYL